MEKRINEKEIITLGIEIFGSIKQFGNWLEMPHNLLGKKPIDLSLEEIHKELKLIELDCYV